MRRSIFLLCSSLFFTAFLSAQVTLTPTVLTSAGGFGESANMSLSWTLGELAVTTLKGTQMIVTQGFQQSFDIGVGLKENEVNWNISVYPNPVGEALRIRFNVEQTGDFLLEVQDVTGRLISQQLHKRIHPGDIVVLNTSTYTDGVYFLKILTPDRQQVQVTSLRKL